MTKIKYNFIVTDIDTLEKFAKNAVVTEKRPVRGMITKMLDAGVDVPGVKIVEEAEPTSANVPEQKGSGYGSSGFHTKMRNKAKEMQL